MSILQKMREQRAELLNKRKAMHDVSIAENRDFTPEEQTQFDALKAEADKLAARIKVAEEIDAEQASLSASTGVATVGLSTPAPAEPVVEPWASYIGTLKAFKPAPGETQMQARERAYASGQWVRAFFGRSESARQWCESYAKRTGQREFALSSNTNTAGGFLVPAPLASTIIDLREQYGVARRFVRQVPMVSDTLKINRRAGGVTANFYGESTAIGTSDPSWNQVELVAKKLGVSTLIPNELIEDAVISIAEWVAQEFAYAFALKEDQCLFLGDGTSTYGGINGLANKIAGKAGAVDAASGHDTFATLDATDIATLMAKLPQYARANARFYCSSVAYDLVFSRIASTAGGNTIQTLGGGFGPSYLGYPIEISQVLPTTTGDLSDTPMLYFGDLSLAATMGTRRDIRMVTSTERFVEYDQTLMLATERFDINVHDVGDESTAGPIVALIGD